MNTNQKNNSGPVSAYLPVKCTVERVTRLTEKERLFRLRPVEGAFVFAPGQFFMAGLPGFGEAPFSVAGPCSSNGTGTDNGHGSFEFCIRAVGSLTAALHRLKKSDTLWVRGPFGKGFDLNELEGKDILFVAGGIGVVPMRGLIKSILARRDSFGALTLIYGSKAPDDILFGEELAQWNESGVKTLVTIDTPDDKWNGHTGVVTTLMPVVQL
ncbi:oxidoreductase, partial [bacterium]